MHEFGASGKIGDVYKKLDITTDAVVRAAKASIADVFGCSMISSIMLPLSFVETLIQVRCIQACSVTSL